MDLTNRLFHGLHSWIGALPTTQSEDSIEFPDVTPSQRQSTTARRILTTVSNRLGTFIT
jgi:hypothetical protein